MAAKRPRHSADLGSGSQILGSPSQIKRVSCEWLDGEAASLGFHSRGSAPLVSPPPRADSRGRFALHRPDRGRQRKAGKAPGCCVALFLVTGGMLAAAFSPRWAVRAFADAVREALGRHRHGAGTRSRARPAARNAALLSARCASRSSAEAGGSRCLPYRSIPKVSQSVGS